MKREPTPAVGAAIPFSAHTVHQHIRNTLPIISSNSVLAVPLGPTIVHAAVPQELLEPASRPPRAPLAPSLAPALQRSPIIPRANPENTTEAIQEQGFFCRICLQKFKPAQSLAQRSGSYRGVCCCCGRELSVDHFSKNQLYKGSARRCSTCVQAGANPLKLIQQTRADETRDVARSIIEKQVLKMEKKQAAVEKRKATMARNKLLKQQQAEERARLGLPPSDEEDEEPQLEQALRPMYIAVRNILRDHRSIERKRHANDLQGPYGQEYELQLLQEETKLHTQAANLCVDDPRGYDAVCEYVHVVDGAVRYGERDHEQGENDIDKPTKHKVKKLTDAMCAQAGEALLDAAKQTAKWRLATERFTAEGGAAAGSASDSTATTSSNKRQRSDADASEASSAMETCTIMGRPKRRATRSVTYVEISDSD